MAHKYSSAPNLLSSFLQSSNHNRAKETRTYLKTIHDSAETAAYSSHYSSAQKKRHWHALRQSK